ncbi:MAG: MmcQ/YjbR family DNA-binding protein [Lachnotalea sp.]
MLIKNIKEYCLSKRGAEEVYPFGEIPICYKISGKIFAQLYPQQDNYKITLKCEPTLADFYRQQYKGTVVRGYHCPPVQQPYYNTVYINDMDENVLLNMIDHSYERVLGALTKKEYKELLGVITKERMIDMGGIYIETIQSGFDQYSCELLSGTQEELYQKINEIRLKNYEVHSYVDFYYGKLSYEERTNLRAALSDKAFSILNMYEYLKEIVFIPLYDDILYLTAELNAKELLFCTYYFCKYPCTIWGNYNLTYPMFAKKE